MNYKYLFYSLALIIFFYVLWDCHFKNRYYSLRYRNTLLSGMEKLFKSLLKLPGVELLDSQQNFNGLPSVSFMFICHNEESLRLVIKSIKYMDRPMENTGLLLYWTLEITGLSNDSLIYTLKNSPLLSGDNLVMQVDKLAKILVS